MTEDLEQWGSDHGYSRYKCPECGRIFWTDGDPRGECCATGDDDDSESDNGGDTVEGECGDAECSIVAE